MDAIAGIEGRAALVTGANRGIGRCFVDLLMESGATRVYAGARDTDSLSPLVDAYGTRLVPIRLDLTQSTLIDDFCKSHDDVALLVSNAGRDGTSNVLTAEEDDVRDLFEVHTMGPWRLATGLAPQIREHRGGMIFVQSIAALVLSRRGPFYSASKAAGTMMAMALREALRADGVRVTNVFPGFTDTDIVRDEAIAKASPRGVALRALVGWAAGEASVFPDRYAEMVHAQLLTNMQQVIDDPAAVATETIRRYATGESAL